LKKLSIVLCLILASNFLNAKEYLCYVPGGAGLSDYMITEVGGALKNKGIPFVAFDAGPWGSVEERSNNILKDFEKLLQEDAEAECHLFGYSMGGLVSRYSANHLNFRSRDGQRIAF
jgi:triacylglycerol esterase/lipase EstA (alpha/beta hydrolase family)